MSRFVLLQVGGVGLLIAFPFLGERILFFVYGEHIFSLNKSVNGRFGAIWGSYLAATVFILSSFLFGIYRFWKNKKSNFSFQKWLAVLSIVLSTAPYFWFVTERFSLASLSVGLVLCANRGDVSRMRRLIAMGADPNWVVTSKGKSATALMFGAVNGNEEVVSVLLAAGAKTGTQNHEGKTAAQIARLKGFAKISDQIEKAQ